MRPRSILLAAGILIVSASAARTETVVLGAQVGAGYLPMNDWDDFWTNLLLSDYQQDRLGLYTEVSVTSRFAERHAVRFSLEWITSSASAAATDGLSAVTFEWDFQTIPVSASYEYALRRTDAGALTIVGAGAGYYMSELTGSASGGMNPQTDKRRGEGYGFHGYLRQTAPISERASLTGMLRGRWADGMAFDDNEGDVPVMFNGVDVSIGIEWTI